MRPGQTAPECLDVDTLKGRHKVKSFNEAGADCPGMRQPERYLTRQEIIASMRPGQTAPECRNGAERPALATFRFNEAGADCPGMRV